MTTKNNDQLAIVNPTKDVLYSLQTPLKGSISNQQALHSGQFGFCEYLKGHDNLI